MKIPRIVVTVMLLLFALASTVAAQEQETYDGDNPFERLSDQISEIAKEAESRLFTMEEIEQVIVELESIPPVPEAMVSKKMLNGQTMHVFPQEVFKLITIISNKLPAHVMHDDYNELRERYNAALSKWVVQPESDTEPPLTKVYWGFAGIAAIFIIILFVSRNKNKTS